MKIYINGIVTGINFCCGIFNKVNDIGQVIFILAEIKTKLQSNKFNSEKEVIDLLKRTFETKRRL